MSSPPSERRLSRKPSPIRPRVEALEDRCLLSASMVADINLTTPGSDPSNLTNVGGTLFFTADDGKHDAELWKSDGTVVGTVLVQDFGPLSSVPALANLTASHGRLFFTLNDGVHGNELWESDGTAVVADLNPGAGSSNPANLTDVNGTLFFTADDGTHGLGLWKTDGTAAGTVLLAQAASFSDLTAAGNTLFFAATQAGGGSEALWASGGSPATTQMVLGVSPDNDLTAVNGTIFFSASDGASGANLWKSDGTAAGTRIVADVPGGIDELTNVAGELFFRVNQSDLWKSDGTATGTAQVVPAIGTLSVDQLTASGGKLYFVDFGRFVGCSGGTAAGTHDLLYAYDLYDSNGPSKLTAVNGTLFFAGGNWRTGVQLWTTAGLVADLSQGDYGPYGDATPKNSFPDQLTNVNGTLFFTFDDRVHGRELWKVDTAPQLTASAGGPYTLTEGGSLTLHAAATDPAGGALTYAWDLSGRGTFTDAAGPSPTLHWSQLRALGFNGGASYSLRVRVTDGLGNTVTSAPVTLAVQDAPLRGAVLPVRAVEGAAFTGAVASFADPGGYDPTAHYTATIAWGDGTVTTGTVGPSGGYVRVSGSHAYAHPGPYTLRVTVADAAGPVTATGTAQVADAPLYARPAASRLASGLAFAGALAFFRDADPAATVGEYQATITWGDGQASAGTVTADGKGGFVVGGGHSYAAAGSYAVAVQVRDTGGSAATARTLLVVSAPPHVLRAPLAFAGLRRRPTQDNEALPLGVLA